MANEITVSGSLSITDGLSPTRALQSGDVLASVTTHTQIFQKMTVGITATAIPVLGLTTPGWAIFVNRDATNYIDLYTDNGANKKAFARIKPGMCCGPIFLGADARAPYALANTLACIMEYAICDT